MSVSRRSVRFTAAALVIGVGGLATAPAFAASEVGHGQASAITIDVAGMEGYSGRYSASNDGKTETTTGNNKPAITVLSSNGQQILNQGTLNQDAWSKASSGTVSSAACAGISGSGATLVAVGDSNCLSDTNPKTINFGSGSVDFTKFDPFTDIVSSGGLNQTFVDTLNQIPNIGGVLTGGAQTGSTALATGLSTALQDFLTALGNPSLTLDAGVIQGACTATDGSTEGDAELVRAGLKLDFGTDAQALGLNPITLALPSDPEPNQDLVVGLGDLTTQLTAALTKSLTNSAASGPLAGVFTAGADLTAVINQVVATAVPQITSQLGPLGQILKGTLNRQTSTSDSQIHVTALDLQVLPAAAQFTGFPLLDLQLGDVDCLGGSVATPTATATPRPRSAVPTDVDSGLSGGAGLPTGISAALGALFLVAAGGIGVRRVKLHRGDSQG